jgi:hypothetical protein
MPPLGITRREMTARLSSADSARRDRLRTQVAHGKALLKPDALAHRAADQRLELTHERVHVRRLRVASAGA